MTNTTTPAQAEPLLEDFARARCHPQINGTPHGAVFDLPVPFVPEADEDVWNETQMDVIVSAVKDHCGPATAARLRRLIHTAQAPAPGEREVIDARPTPETRALGACLKKMRLAHGLLLGDAAVLIGCTSAYLSQLEHGRKPLTAEVATAIATWADELPAHPRTIRPSTAPVQPKDTQAGWRDHVEDRMRSWRQSFVNSSGDQLALDDFMDGESLEDLIDFVCDAWVEPAAAVVAGAVAPTLWRYRRWTPDIDGEGYLLSPWYETRTDPRATLANQNTAPLAEVVPLYAGEPVLKADAPAGITADPKPPVQPLGAKE